jgi:transposase
MNQYQPKRAVVLTAADRQKLRDITKKGKQSARVIARAKALLKSEQGSTDKAIASELETTIRTIENIRARFADGGLDRALYDAPRSGQPRKLDDKAEAHLVALACSDPPDGRDRWTLKLLQAQMVRDKKVKSISDVCILQYLQRRNLKPWREKNVVHSEDHPGIH